jgi:serine protease Do
MKTINSVTATTLSLIFATTLSFSPVNATSFALQQERQSNRGTPIELDFREAANKAINGVVHVRMVREREQDEISAILERFFGPPDQEREQEPEEGVGSGVIITNNGYIVTNYHVVAEALEIEVTLHDQRQFTAQLVGGDPNTDIAILKIEANDLPYIEFGNSGELEIGEWVLAVGNPFGLTSSVTAGIISAKERTLGVLQEGDMPLESFLQTDAAINVGNSGGALVNLDGQLVGVPTLIISPTRTNIGAGFAVPVAIVERVARDIIEYGEVRRGILGISIRDITPNFAEEQGFVTDDGVYVERIVGGGAADRAGLREGDVILEVNGSRVNSPGELQMEVSRYHPGESVDFLVMRDGDSQELTASLIGVDDHMELVMQQEETVMGATFRMVPQEHREKFGLPGGVQVTEIESGEFQQAGIREGFIIVGINNQLIGEPRHVAELLEDHSGPVVLQGIYPDGTMQTYRFNL